MLTNKAWFNHQHRENKCELITLNYFSNKCYWFVDNKLHILVRIKQNQYFLPLYFKKSYIKYVDIQIKQHSKFKYLGCLLDKIMSEKAMALDAINKINNKLKFLHRKKSFLTSVLRCVLCNA